VAVDDELLGDGGVERTEEAQQVILMPNGCMCCRVRGDLVAALRRLIVGVIGQSTTEQATSSPAGLVPNQDGASEADPAKVSGGQGGGGDVTGPTVGSANLDGVIIECSGLDELAPILQVKTADSIGAQAVAGTADALAPSATDASATLVMSQLALSDRVLLNKSDLITSSEGNALVEAVKRHFPGASATLCVRGGVDIDLVLGVESFSLDNALEMDQHFADILKDSDLVGVAHSHQHHGDGDKDTERDGKGSPNAPDTRTHGHDRLGARSVGVELTDGPIDWVKFKQWLKDFLEEEKERIWRLKGVLWTIASGATTPWGTGAGSRTVVQGLYGHFETEVGDWPAGATRRTRLVFIGDLPSAVQESLKTGVRSCVAKSAPRPAPPPTRKATTSLSGGAGGTGFANRFGTVKFGGRDDDNFLL
ncbi:unnamed protein product, partial [Sphacelaria rigidula]